MHRLFAFGVSRRDPHGTFAPQIVEKHQALWTGFDDKMLLLYASGTKVREIQPLALIANGLSNKLIARDLGISDGSVKVYVRNLLRKFRLGSRLELAAWVHRHGAGLASTATAR